MSNLQKTNSKRNHPEKNPTGKNRVPNIAVFPHQNTRRVDVCCIEDIDENDYTAETIYMHNYVHHH